MQPVTGPFSEESNVIGRYQSRSVWRQAAPYNLRLPYKARSTWSNNPYNTPAAFSIEPTQNESNLVLNKCYDRFHSKVRNTSSNAAGWLMTIAEHQKAREMFNKRCTNLLEYITKLERNFRKSRVRGTIKDWASVFLEARFGWLPIINDVYSTLEILSSNPKTGLVKASATAPYTFVVQSDSDWSVRANFSGKIRYSMIADVQVSNPNLYLLNQLGLINPAVVAWDRVPWGFLLDWWFNLSQVASSITDTYGLAIKNSVTTEKYDNSGTYGYYRTGDELVDNYTYETQSISRELGIRGPVLALKPFTGLSVVRGVTAIALTLQLLPKDPPLQRIRRNPRRRFTWQPGTFL